MAEVFGLEVDDLPAHHTAVRVLVVIESLLMEDTDGDVRKLSVRVSDGLTYWDVMGMAGAAKADAEAQWLGALNDGEDHA